MVHDVEIDRGSRHAEVAEGDHDRPSNLASPNSSNRADDRDERAERGRDCNRSEEYDPGMLEMHVRYRR
jgi:hypothetical protein